MVKYIDCLPGNDGKVYIRVIPLSVTRFNFINRLWTSIVHPVLNPTIIYTMAEAKKLGFDYKKNPKGFYIKSAEGIRIPVKIELKDK